MRLPGWSLGYRLCLVGIYELHLRKRWHYCCVTAVSVGSATEERIEHVYCYSCCVSQERIDVSAIPAASRVSSLLAHALPTLGSANSADSVTSEANGVTNMMIHNTHLPEVFSGLYTAFVGSIFRAILPQVICFPYAS